MNSKKLPLCFTLLALAYQINVSAHPFSWFDLFNWLDTIGSESAEQFNQKRTEEILATSKAIEEWIDGTAESAGKDGAEWIDKTAQDTSKSRKKRIEKIAESIGKKGAKRIDEVTKSTRKAAEDYIEASAAHAYARGYKFGYNSTIKAAPWIVGSAIVGTATYLCIKNI